MATDDLSGNEQAQPHALHVLRVTQASAPQGLEDDQLQLGRDGRPLVVHGQADMLRSGLQPHLARRRFRGVPRC